MSLSTLRSLAQRASHKAVTSVLAPTPHLPVPQRAISGIGHKLPMWMRRLPRKVKGDNSTALSRPEEIENREYFRNIDPAVSETWSERYKKGFLPLVGDRARPEFFSGSTLFMQFFVTGTGILWFYDTVTRMYKDDTQDEYSEAVLAKMKWRKRLVYERTANDEPGIFPGGEPKVLKWSFRRSIERTLMVYWIYLIVDATPYGEEIVFPKEVNDWLENVGDMPGIYSSKEWRDMVKAEAARDSAGLVAAHKNSVDKVRAQYNEEVIELQALKKGNPSPQDQYLAGVNDAVQKYVKELRARPAPEGRYGEMNMRPEEWSKTVAGFEEKVVPILMDRDTRIKYFQENMERYKKMLEDIEREAKNQ